jgi:hypothetical protein
MPRRNHVQSPVSLLVINETGRKSIAASESFDAAGNMIVRITDAGTCEWWHSGEEGDDWNTGCGRQYRLSDGKPADYGIRFCPYCGERLKEERT